MTTMASRQRERCTPAMVSEPTIGSGTENIKTADKTAHTLSNDKTEGVSSEHGDDGDGIEAPDNKTLENEADRRYHERCREHAEPNW